MIIFRSLIVWAIIVFAESLHGTARRLLLEPQIGEFRAKQLSVLTGALIIILVARACSRWIGARLARQLLGIGLLWTVLTVGFELAIGRLALGYSWEQITADYNLPKGGLMPLGLAWLMLSPLIAAAWRGILLLRHAPPQGPEPTNARAD